ncbi:MAG: type III-A CRISPR-associated RAMP protein Csm5 [Methanobacteriaceae archaeon]|jgi:CRISPR type III-A-associated RAMP protein Csm5|nr:type III-A CRISPR-associated RAMP protein Csm5 [Candidatus Methanorudis spinitermitis]
MFDSNIKSYECKIQTLTPVHIGSGNKYSPSEYVSPELKNKKGNIIHLIRRINFDKYYSSLSDDKKDEFLENITNFNFKLNEFDSEIPKKFKRYNSINKTSNKFPKEIIEHIRTLDELFIPGSSLKGAIKTAIVYNLIDYSHLDDIKYLFKRGKFGEFIHPFENFTNSFFSSQKGGKSAQYNISKFFQVFDSSTIQTADVHNIISIMGKRDSYDGFQYYKRNNRLVESFFETIPNKKSLKSKISINYNPNIYKKLNLKNKENLIDITNIKEYIYNFSKDIIDYELEFLDKYSYSNNDLSTVNSKLIKYYEQLNNINTLETPIIKLGAGSGFMAMTIGIKIKNLDGSLFERIRNSLRGENYGYEFPKSRKIIERSNMPLGWVKLKFD